MTVDKNTKVTIGVVISLLGVLSSYVYAMITLPDKKYVDSRVDDLKDDVKYIRGQVDYIKGYLLEKRK